MNIQALLKNIKNKAKFDMFYGAYNNKIMTNDSVNYSDEEDDKSK